MSSIPIDQALLNKQPYIEDWSIVLAYRGSIAHGMYVPGRDPNSIDDKDVHGIMIPPPEFYYGLKEFGSRGTKEIMDGEWDIVLYELRKAVRMLLQGNPNVLGILWLKPEHYLKMTPAGQLLIDNRKLFVGKHVYNSFIGYARGQRHGLTKGAYQGYMGARRKALVDQFGFDPKAAGHLIRLLRMGIEFLSTGELIVSRPDAPELMEIKVGRWSLEKVQREADMLFAQAEEALRTSKLPEGPDLAKVEELCMQVANEWLCAHRGVGYERCIAVPGYVFKPDEVHTREAQGSHWIPGADES